MKVTGKLAASVFFAALVLGFGVAKADPRNTSAPAWGRVKVASPEAWARAERDAEGDVRIIVIQREGADTERAASRLERRLLGRRGRSFTHIAGDVIKVPASRLEDVLADLEADPDVEVVAPDRKDQQALTQTTPWGIVRIGADPVSRGSRSGAGVKVAVIDSGIWASSSGAVHPDLAAAYRGGYDFVNNDPYPWDDYGHGTHVAGVIAATDNSFGVVGAAPGVSLYALKVLDQTGSGWDSDFIAALDWCVANGVRIANYSVGSYASSAPVEEACNRARAAGITVIAASGNDGLPLVIFPAAYPSVIAVGSSDKSDQVSVFSNFGNQVDLVAPGELVRSTYLGGGYLALDGTSMATPHVAGAAALLAGRGISDPRLVQEYLEATAVDVGVPGVDPQSGHGRVNAAGSLSQPPPAILKPLAGMTVPSGRNYQVTWGAVPGAATYRLLFARGAAQRWIEVVASTAFTSATWRAPVVGAPLTTGRLQLAAYDATGRLLAVRTWAGFTVRSLRITAPVAGASVPGGMPLQLSWEVYATPRPVATIAVERWDDVAGVWKRLRNLSSAARSYSWLPPVVAVERPERLRVILLDTLRAPISSMAVAFRVVPAGR